MDTSHLSKSGCLLIFVIVIGAALLGVGLLAGIGAGFGALVGYLTTIPIGWAVVGGAVTIFVALGIYHVISEEL